MSLKQIILTILLLFFLVLLLAIFWTYSLFSAPAQSANLERFIIHKSDNSLPVIINNLYNQGFIKNRWAFKIAYGTNPPPAPGGYEISKSMPAFKLQRTLKSTPILRWVTIPEGVRKEEIASILAKSLNWSKLRQSDWLQSTDSSGSYAEGVFFPDTYLIPITESNAEITQRLINNFNEKFSSLSDAFIEENIKWTTALKIASLIQREASGPNDMPLIAGIIWNRLLNDMKLDIDATLQYIKGHKEGSWWPPISPKDKLIDSPFNTYIYKGLPPHPIANPGLAAISAVLNPADTNCFYYLHVNGNTYCSRTYDEHQDNINKYLK